MKRIDGVTLVGICAATGSHSYHTGKKFGFRYSDRDESRILSDIAINTVVVTTRHHLHAGQVLAAPERESIFCEKPLCLNRRELSEIARASKAHESANKLLMVDSTAGSLLSHFASSFLLEIQEPLALLPGECWLHSFRSLLNDPHKGRTHHRRGLPFCGFPCLLVGAARLNANAQPAQSRYTATITSSPIRFADGRRYDQLLGERR
jgi:hypothetical protein